jgi:hypothetical protein
MQKLLIKTEKKGEAIIIKWCKKDGEENLRCVGEGETCFWLRLKIHLASSPNTHSSTFSPLPPPQFN